MVERDLLYAYQGLKDTTKGEESVEDHLPTSFTQGASNLHSDEDMEDKIKLLDPRVQKLITTYLEVSGRAPPEGRGEPRGAPGGVGGPGGPRKDPPDSDSGGVARQGADVASFPGGGGGAPHHGSGCQQLAPPSFAQRPHPLVLPLAKTATAAAEAPA